MPRPKGCIFCSPELPNKKTVQLEGDLRDFLAQSIKTVTAEELPDRICISCYHKTIEAKQFLEKCRLMLVKQGKSDRIRGAKGKHNKNLARLSELAAEQSEKRTRFIKGKF